MCNIQMYGHEKRSNVSTWKIFECDDVVSTGVAQIASIRDVFFFAGKLEPNTDANGDALALLYFFLMMQKEEWKNWPLAC